MAWDSEWGKDLSLYPHTALPVQRKKTMFNEKLYTFVKRVLDFSPSPKVETTEEGLLRSIEELEKENSRLDNELNQAIDREIHSSIILPDQVSVLQKEKKELEETILRLEEKKRIVIDDIVALKKEREGLGTYTIEVIQDEKKRLVKEVEELGERVEFMKKVWGSGWHVGLHTANMTTCYPSTSHLIASKEFVSIEGYNG